MKKIISLLLSFLMILSLLPAVPAFAEGEGDVEVERDWEYLDEDSNLKISYDVYHYSTGPEAVVTAVRNIYSVEDGSMDVVIPDYLGEYPVTRFAGGEINRPAFRSIQFPKFVREIGASEQDWSNYFSIRGSYLEEVRFPEDCALTLIGYQVFMDCRFTQIALPDSVTDIEKQAFYQSKLETVQFSDSLVSIGEEAFYETSLSEVILPDSLKTIGNYAFAECVQASGEPSIQTLDLGGGVQKIGYRAFDSAAITTLQLPDSLQEIGYEAFRYNESLKDVLAPANPDPEFVSFNGFSYCDLSGTVEIPSTIRRIEEECFSQSNINSIVIPQGVEYIGKNAFFRSALAQLSITAGGAPLTIGEGAFEDCNNLVNGEIDLPERVSVIERNAFYNLGLPAGKTDSEGIDLYICPLFRIHNKNIRITCMEPDPESGNIYYNGGDDPFGSNWATSNFNVSGVEDRYSVCIYYPADLTEESSPSFTAYKNHWQNEVGDYSREMIFRAMEEQPPVILTHRIAGTVPEGAEVVIAAGSETLKTAWDGLQFSAEAKDGVPVSVTIRLDGYQNNVYEKSAEEFTADWNLGAIQKTDFTPYSTTGTLRVTTEGAGSLNANIAVFDEAENLLASGRAAGTMYLKSELPSGAVKVVAFANNEFFSRISSEADLAALGVATYGRAEAAILPMQTTELTIQVPKMDTAALSGIAESSKLLCEATSIVTGLEFNLRLNYKMAVGRKADGIALNIPKGLTVLSVSTVNQDYGTSVNISSLAAADRERGDLFVRVRAERAGNYSVNAVITSGSFKVPAGSCGFHADSLKLEVPKDSISDTEFAAKLYGPPNTPVSITVGFGAPVVWTTNYLGRVSGTLNLPTGTVTGETISVIAEASYGGSTLTAEEDIYVSRQTEKLMDAYFIHAERYYALVSGGEDKSNRHYTYISNGEEKNKYWTISATYSSLKEMSDSMDVDIIMEDGSIRTVKMSLIEQMKDGENYIAKYGGMTYINQYGDHVFVPSVIPAGFRFFPEQVGREPLQLAPANFQYLYQKAAADQNKRAEGYVPPEEDPEYDPDFDFMYVIHHRTYVITEEEDGEWVDYLEPEEKEAVTEAEKTVEEIADISKLGGDKKISECGGLPEYLEDKGIEFETDVPFDAGKLEEKGFTVANDGTQKVAIKENIDPKTKELKGFTYTNEGGQLLDVDYTKGAFDGLQDSVLNNIYNGGCVAFDKFGEKLTEKAIETAVNKCFDGKIARAASAAEREAILSNKSSFMNKAKGKVKLLKQAGGYGLAGLGFGLGCFNAYKNSKSLENYEKAVAGLQGDIDNMETWERFYASHGAGQKCLDAMRLEREAAQILLDELKGAKKAAYRDTIVGAVFTAIGAATALPSLGSGAAIAAGANLAYDVAANWANMSRAERMDAAAEVYQQAAVNRMHDCKDEELELPEPENVDTKWMTAIHDPSGIVFEAVESNPVKGVTATIRETSESGAWDAESYDQLNPQITGADGAYAWDVPRGEWVVEFTKEGYENASTDALVVPPPRLNLRTGLISKAAPQVESIKAYTDYTEIVFTQYMDVASPIQANGYTLKWIGSEPAGDGSGKEFSKVLQLIPSSKRKVGENSSVAFSGAKNYAGKEMSSYSASVKVEVRPAEIALNYNEAVAILMNENPVPRITARILNSDGDPMEGLKVSVSGYSSLFAEVTAVRDTTDASGVAVFEAKGLLPGRTDLTFTVEGTSLKKTIPLQIDMETNQVERPSAMIGTKRISEGDPKETFVTVPPGVSLTLACGTEGAQIYYSLNDTCPCQDTAGRILYEGPITITEDSYFRISAYKDGMEYSERLNIHVTVDPGIFMKGDVDGDGAVTSKDLTLLAKHVAKIRMLGSQAAIDAGDVDSDGVVSAKDLTLLAKYSAGIIPGF